MSSEVVLNLSVPELLRALNEKLGLECIRAQEDCLPPILGSIPSLGAEIDGLESTVQDVLKLIPSLRNLLQPANRLLPETLSHIARYVPHENARDASPMIPLTHVCRYWRQSIISTPKNWTQISSRSKGLVALSLQRAKAAPLEVNLDMRQAREIPVFSDLMAPHIQNIEVLHIRYILTARELEQTLPNFPQSTPNLRSLSLFPKLRNAEWDWSTSGPFGPLTPALARLSLTDIPLYPSFLHLRSLTHLSLRHDRFDLHLDMLLDFLEENRSLEHTVLDIRFPERALRSLRRRLAIGNRLRNLTIASVEAVDGHVLISNIALQKGAHLEISLYDESAGLDDLISIISMTHLSNLQSPTIMEYHPDCGSIRLLGFNGSFSFVALGLENPFAGLLPSHLTNVRVLRIHRAPESYPSIDPIAFHPLSLPALETLCIEREVAVSHLLFALLSDPSSSPSLKILAFLDCGLDEGFMEELARFASSRKNTTSAWLYRVVIVNSKVELPSIASINELGKHVPVVDARIGKELPVDLV